MVNCWFSESNNLTACGDIGGELARAVSVGDWRSVSCPGCLGADYPAISARDIELREWGGDFIVTNEPMTLTEALARDMFANEHDDAAPGATDEAWAEDADLRAFWTARSTRAIAFMAEWRVQARLAALPPVCACGSTMTACFSTVEYESRRCCEECAH